MKIVLVVLGVLVGIVVLVAVIGAMLPATHTVQRSSTYRATPDVVFAAITDVEKLPEWRASVRKVDLDLSNPALPRFTEDGSNGKIRYVIEEKTAPRRVVTRIDDPSLPFGGTWTYELTPIASGTMLRITENGEVRNPIFRFMSKFIFSHHRTVETYLTELGARLGSPAIITT